MPRQFQALSCFFVLMASCLISVGLAAELSDDEKDQLRRQILGFIEAHDLTAAGERLRAHPQYPAADMEPDWLDPAQAWLRNSHNMLAMAYQINQALAASDKRAADYQLVEKSRSAATVIKVQGGRVLINELGRKHWVNLTDLSLADYYGIGAAMLDSMPDRPVLDTQKLVWRLLYDRDAKEYQLKNMYKHGDHVLADFAASEIPGYLAAAKAPASSKPKSRVEASRDKLMAPDLDVPDPLDYAELRQARQPRNRHEQLKTYADTERVTQAIARAHEWLAQQQSDDGSWKVERFPIVPTSFALQSFLAEGHIPGTAPYGRAVQRGLDWLADALLTSEGAAGDHLASHALAVETMAEAYTLTGERHYFLAMEHGVAVLLDQQQKDGGYSITFDRRDQPSSIKYSCMFVAPLVAAKAAGSRQPGLDRALERLARYIAKSLSDVRRVHGHHALPIQLLGYGDSSTGERALLRLAQDQPRDLNALMQDDEESWRDALRLQLVEWYWVTRSFRMAGDRHWRRWRDAVEAALLPHQHDNGAWSFPQIDAYDAPDRRFILATAISTLILQTPYRYPPDYGARVKRAR